MLTSLDNVIPCPNLGRCQIIGVNIPADQNIEMKGNEMIGKYFSLKRKQKIGLSLKK